MDAVPELRRNRTAKYGAYLAPDNRPKGEGNDPPVRSYRQQAHPEQCRAGGARQLRGTPLADAALPTRDAASSTPGSGVWMGEGHSTEQKGGLRDDRALPATATALLLLGAACADEEPAVETTTSTALTTTTLATTTSLRPPTLPPTTVRAPLTT